MNALIHEASPYLRQHAHNPVDWLPWSDVAFEKAARENKPVFLSIGYAACHWCHVMERESFENEDIARFLNENFVCIKVDREERPDVDHHYLEAVQRLTGQGGWPLSVFLTPERKPFFGGTYWPPETKYSRPGFHDVLYSVAHAWQESRSAVLESAGEIQNALAALPTARARSGEISDGLLVAAVRASERAFDGVYGGFGGAPKFPHAMELNLLLRLARRLKNPRAQEMALFTLRKMARGGIYDQLGGGFHRYSTDARWLVPHFEKMLYDNALLVRVYLDAYVLTGDPEFQRVARETLDWAMREMSVPEGGFASSLDADAGGEEGTFYVWTPAQINAVLGEARGSRFAQIYDVSASGNFEHGQSVLNLPQVIESHAERLGVPRDHLERELAEDRARLLVAREERIRPARDDKVLTDWNGLMITALVRGFAVLGDQKYLDAAEFTADRLLTPYEKSGKLVHSFLGDRTLGNQLLLDYAALGNGLLDLFMTDGNARWFAGAISLARKLDPLFSGNDGLYAMSVDPIAGTSPADPYDSALPSGNSLAGNLMARLFHLTGDEWYKERARGQIEPLAGVMSDSPTAFSQAMVTVNLLLNPPAQLVLMGDTDRAMWKVAQESYHSDVDVLWSGAYSLGESPELSALLEGKVAIGGKPTAYLCRNFVCQLPTTSLSDLRQSLSDRNSAKVEASTP